MRWFRVHLDGKYYWLDPGYIPAERRTGESFFSGNSGGAGWSLGDTTTTALSLIPVQDNGAVTAHESFQNRQP